MSDTLPTSKWEPILYSLVTALIIISIDLSIGSLQSISSYASINSEDVAILLASVALFCLCTKRDNWKLAIHYPTATVVLLAVSFWIFITVLVAIFRADSSALPSVLWSFKIIELLIFFIVLQQIGQKSGVSILKTINIVGIFIGALSVTLELMGADRVQIVWGNPNLLASFLILIAMINLAKAISETSLTGTIVHYAASLIAILAIFTTGSRSGMLGLLSGVGILVILLRNRITTTQAGAGIGVGIVGLATTLLLIDADDIRRFLNWIEFENGRLVLADTVSAMSIEIRLQLIQRALDLFAKQPFFGYGWFAAPSRVGWIDVYYATMLVELGIPGFLLMLCFHGSIVLTFLRARSKSAFVYGSAAVGWYVGLLVQSIGGAFPRVPQMLFLTVLVVAAVGAVGRPTAS